MKYGIFVLFLMIAAAQAAAQSPTPSPRSSSADDGVKISTSVIQVDLTVTDKKGNPIRDLQPGDVEIFENGKKQEITGFRFVSRRPAPEVLNNTGRSQSGVRSKEPPLPSGPPKAENVRRTIAIVVDDLSLNFASTFWVRQALRKYVNEQVEEGDLVAIIRTAGGIGALQQFTFDKRQLLAAIENVKYSPFSSGGVSSFEPIRPSLKEQISVMKDGVKDLRPEAEAERDLERANDESRSSNFVSGTLGAVNFIIRGMQELPGRKSIVLMSDGIPLIGRDERGLPKSSAVVAERMRRLVEAANRASVVIYTIDGRGLEVPGPQAMDEYSEAGYDAALRSRELKFSDSQDGLRYLAAETGGMAFINQNDINHGLGKVMDDQSYYLVAYEPDELTFDPNKSRYNQIEIKVNRPDVRVRYRSGFFGITDEQIAKTKPAGATATINALASPFAVNDIPIALHTLFSADNNNKGWLKSYLHIDAKQLKFSPAAGNTHKASFEIIAFSYGDNGVPSDQITKEYSLTIPDFAYARSLEKGIVYQFAFPVKKGGSYQYRVAIRDIATNKVGSASQFVEVPNIKKDRILLSGVALEAITRSDWQKFTSGTITSEDLAGRTDPQTDTALRRFKQGEVMRFAVDIYNASAARSGLSAKMQIYKDGNLHFDGKANPIKTDNSQRSAEYTGGMILGKDMLPGDYILRVEVTDPAKGAAAAYQFVPFEIVE